MAKKQSVKCCKGSFRSTTCGNCGMPNQFEASPPEKEPGPRCPDCGNTELDFYSLDSGAPRVGCGECNFEFHCDNLADFAQFFPPSPQEPWVPVVLGIISEYNGNDENAKRIMQRVRETILQEASGSKANSG